MPSHKPSRVRVGFYLTRDQHDLINKAAQHEGMVLSSFVRFCALQRARTVLGVNFTPNWSKKATSA